MGWLGHLSKAKNLRLLQKEIINCHACPRLVEWREEIAHVKRKSYADQNYWGKPIPGFGSESPRMLIIGLAPGAHGANRTGRVFTGDSSGDWLYGSLHRLGLAKIATSISRDDGQELFGVRISTAVRCAPPNNKPTTQERDECGHFFNRELALIEPSIKSFVALGSFAWTALFKGLHDLVHQVKAPKFAHSASLKYTHEGTEYLVIASYHPSQQNTFTGKLTRPMLDSVLRKAAKFCALPPRI